MIEVWNARVVNRMRVILVVLIFLNISFSEEIYSSFYVLAKQEAKLSLSSIGIVKKINVNTGDFVKKGDILLELDFSSENIGLENSKKDYEIAKISEEFNKKTLDRFENMRGSVSKQEYDSVLFKYQNSLLNLNKAQIAIKNYENLIDKKILKAPFDGVILAKYIELGEGVASPAQTLFKIYSYPDVKLLLSFDSKYLSLVKTGQTFNFKIDTQAQPINATVDLIYPEIDARTGKISAECYTTNLVPGTFGEGKILVQ